MRRKTMDKGNKTSPVSKHGAVGIALMQAAQEFGAEGATVREIATKAQVGWDCARTYMPKLRQRGYVKVVGERKVDYRHRPVLIYAVTEKRLVSSNVAEHNFEPKEPMKLLLDAMRTWGQAAAYG
jgi:hypothetical protein